MPFAFYNTLTRTIEEFKPGEPGTVRMYNCGPTVYDHPHIGNFRSFLFADTLRRSLEFGGFGVRQIMNITDVGHLTVDDMRETGEDKLEAAARKAGVSDPLQIAEKYKVEFDECLQLLNFRKAEAYPRATGHIPEMIEMIRSLVERGYAYEVAGNLYYDVTRFPGYGRLSNNTLDELRAGARVEVNPEKRHPADFALWKRDSKHLMQWESPWGRGFPGWHIECSAMSRKYLGDTLDIHTGGEDNIFPHHECEIAQSESVSGKPFVRLWMHARHLFVNGRKMSKSEGTFFTIRDILDRGFEAMVLRLHLISVHYRSNLNFTMEELQAQRQALERLRTAKSRLVETLRAPDRPRDQETSRIARRADAEFLKAIQEDLNVSRALGVVFDYIRLVHQRLDAGAMGPGDAEEAYRALMKMDSVLGVLEREEAQVLESGEQDLLQRRDEARLRRDFAQADALRAELRKRGVILEDTRAGTKWKRVR